MDDMGSLVSVCEAIPQLRTEVRGQGRAAFVYARSNHKAIELSIAPPGFLLEGWEVSDEDSDEPPAISLHLHTIKDVEECVRQWFLGLEDAG